MVYSDYKIHHLKGYIQSIYLVEYKDKILLLDGGSRGDVKRIWYFITDTLKRPMSDLKLIIVTHLHPDHAGAAPHLRKKFGTPIAGHPELDYWYQGFWGIAQHFLDTSFAWYVAIKERKKYKRMWFQRSVKPDYQLRDGDTLPFFEDWKSVCTPGHTTHDISIYNKKDEVIYIGDLALIVKNKYALPFPIALPKLMEKSLSKVSKLPVNRILFAHGGVESNTTADVFNKVRMKLKNYPPPQFKNMEWFTNMNSAIKKHCKERNT